MFYSPVSALSYSYGTTADAHGSSALQSPTIGTSDSLCFSLAAPSPHLVMEVRKIVNGIRRKGAVVSVYFVPFITARMAPSYKKM